MIIWIDVTGNMGQDPESDIGNSGYGVKGEIWYGKNEVGVHQEVPDICDEDLQGNKYLPQRVKYKLGYLDSILV